MEIIFGIRILWKAFGHELRSEKRTGRRSAFVFTRPNQSTRKQEDRIYIYIKACVYRMSRRADFPISLAHDNTWKTRRLTLCTR